MTPPRDLSAGAAALGWAALACGLAQAPGLLPSSSGASSPVALASWLALLAPALGYLLAARGVSVLALAPAALVVWGASMALLSRGAERGEGLSPWASVALVGLLCAGCGLQGLLRAPAWGAAGLLWLTCGLLAALPGQGQLSEVQLGRTAPRAAALALDLSPLSLVLETGGIDWMRRPAVYEAAGVDWLGDRRPHRAPLAACVCFVVGFGAALLGGRRRARHADCNSS